MAIFPLRSGIDQAVLLFMDAVVYNGQGEKVAVEWPGQSIRVLYEHDQIRARSETGLVGFNSHGSLLLLNL